ncbi:MAG: glycosyltransferase family 9 protein, partial [candidate division Zixibacteria bacterium]|nr:glycosyltransferase family 9 protein [candidate division Zixibacteria bacterium]
MSRTIIIRTPNHLGDCIMALPMINETREAYAGSTVTVLVPEHLADLFESNPAVDQVLKIPTEHVHGLIAVMKIKDIIAPHSFNIGYILPPSFGSAAGFKLGGVKERIGYIADGRRLLLSRPLPMSTPLSSSHRSETYLNLLRRGAGIDIEFVRPKLFVNERDLEKVAATLDRFDISEQDDYAVVAFQAVAASRRWGQQKYVQAIKQIVSRFKLKVILSGSKEEAPVGDEIAAAAGTREVINLAGKTTLRETLALVSRARFFLGNDSGPAHLAAAVGTPLVVLSGADDPNETSPI